MTMTWEQVGAIVAVLVPVLGLIFTVWVRVSSAIRKNADDLAAYKTHVAETYLPKSGLDKAVEQIMGAMSEIKQTIDRMGDRIDRVAESKITRSTRT